MIKHFLIIIIIIHNPAHLWICECDQDKEIMKLIVVMAMNAIHDELFSITDVEIS